MFRLWKWYQNCLSSHPVKTQVISSGLIWGVGDIAAQTITHSTAKKDNQIQTQVKNTHYWNPLHSQFCINIFRHFLLLFTIGQNGSLFCCIYLWTLVLVKISVCLFFHALAGFIPSFFYLLILVVFATWIWDFLPLLFSHECELCCLLNRLMHQDEMNPQTSSL